VRNLWGIALIIDDICAKVACTFYGFGVQIWPGFCLGKIYTQNIHIHKNIHKSCFCSSKTLYKSRWVCFRRMYFNNFEVSNCKLL